MHEFDDMLSAIESVRALRRPLVLERRGRLVVVFPVGVWTFYFGPLASQGVIHD